MLKYLSSFRSFYPGWWWEWIQMPPLRWDKMAMGDQSPRWGFHLDPPWSTSIHPLTRSIHTPLQGTPVSPKFSWILGSFQFLQMFDLWPVCAHFSKGENKNQNQKIFVLKSCRSVWCKCECFSPAVLLLFIPSPVSTTSARCKLQSTCKRVPEPMHSHTKIWILLFLITNHHLW